MPDEIYVPDEWDRDKLAERYRGVTKILAEERRELLHLRIAAGREKIDRLVTLAAGALANPDIQTTDGCVEEAIKALDLIEAHVEGRDES